MKKSLAELIDRKKIKRGYSGFLICRNCEKRFKSTQARVDRGLGKYCSKKCYGEAKKGISRPGIGEKISKTKQAKSKKLRIICEVCKKDIVLTPGTANGRRTCSRKCSGVLNSNRLKIMWKNPPEEMIEKMRIAMVKRRSKGRIAKETKPERVFREELQKRNIVFESQFGFDGIMIADFFIPAFQAFVFCDGSYWHSLISSKEKDWQQVEYARSKGMKAYRFTEKQIYENVSECVDKVLEDTKQPFTFSEIIDKYTILAIKKEFSSLKQVSTDYRRMEKVVISGLDFYKIPSPKEIISLLKQLFELNIKIFMEMEKENGSLDVVKTLNKQRSDVKNAINKYFNESEEIKTYE